ncbi:hypothetical protein ABK040_001441 [Willaertia magna]
MSYNPTTVTTTTNANRGKAYQMQQQQQGKGFYYTDNNFEEMLPINNGNNILNNNGNNIYNRDPLLLMEEISPPEYDFKMNNKESGGINSGVKGILRNNNFDHDISTNISDFPSPYINVEKLANNCQFIDNNKRKEFLQQKLTFLKKQNANSLEHYQTIKEDLRQNKEIIEKKLFQAYNSIKKDLELAFEESLRNLKEMESNMREPIDEHMKVVKKNIKSIESIENSLSTQSYSELIKEKVDNSLKKYVPPPIAEDVIELDNFNKASNFPIFKYTTGSSSSSKPSSSSGGGHLGREEGRRKEGYSKANNNNRKASSPTSSPKGRKESKKLSSGGGVEEFMRRLDMSDDSDKLSSHSGREPFIVENKKRRSKQPSDSVLGSYKELENIYMSTKKYPTFKNDIHNNVRSFDKQEWFYMPLLLNVTLPDRKSTVREAVANTRKKRRRRHAKHVEQKRKSDNSK